MSIKTFPVFGDSVEVVVDKKSTRGTFSVIVQNTQPGGGPPPHAHEREDEAFLVLEGEFELFQDQKWTSLACGELKHSKRREIHAFRNCGTRVGRILVFAMPGGLDEYLESISCISMPEDAERLYAISEEYGISFPRGEQVATLKEQALTTA